ncbi:MAG: hypothetical protein EHM89_01300 [Acidobacteria bacterium]|nr:MAG: hypothetical protein EHM89_01300 [Acidobacteriota bacterium]
MKLTIVLLAALSLTPVATVPGIERGDVTSLAAAQSAPSPGLAPRGRVRLAGRVLQDDRGPFLGLGATLFWSVWGYQHDRPRLVQHFDLLRAHGFEFVRVLGSVAGPSWQDRAADPRAVGYDAAIAGVTDVAFEHGLRVGWTVFGDTVATATPASRQALIDRFLAMSKGREHKILFIEVANEGWQNGFNDRLEELQALGRSLNERTDIPITLTSPPPPLQCGKALTAIYGAGAADFLSLHFDRDLKSADGRWGPVRQPLKWPALFASCRAGLPDVAANGEPVGPQSSVASEGDPVYILSGMAVSFVAGLPIYVWHTGPGVRGGGKSDRALNRAASLAELPRVQEMLRGFAALKGRLPADLPGWSRVDLEAANSPLRLESSGARKLVDVAAAQNGTAMALVPFGLRDETTLIANLPVRIEVLHPVTGMVLDERALQRGGRMPLPANPAALVILVTKRPQ